MKKIVLLLCVSGSLAAMETGKEEKEALTHGLAATYGLVINSQPLSEPLSQTAREKQWQEARKNVLWHKMANRVNGCGAATWLSFSAGITGSVLAFSLNPPGTPAIVAAYLGCAGALFGSGVMVGMCATHSTAVDVIENREI